MNAPINLGFDAEARQLADDDHHDLSRRLEEMLADCTCTWQDIQWWMRDENWRDDEAEYFAANRAHYLEKAREMFAEGVA